MITPRLAALISILAAAPAFSQPLIPVVMGPAGPGQCVVGSEGCGTAGGGSMDPVSEDALVGLGQMAVPIIRADLPERTVAENKPAVAATKPQDDSNAGPDFLALGGQIINPLSGAAPMRGAIGMNLGTSAPARQAAFDTHIDGNINPAPVAKAAGLSYYQSQKVEAIISVKGTGFGSDPKLSAGDANFAPGPSSTPR